MEKKFQLPFQGLSSENWFNLLLVALVTYFIIYSGMPLFQGDWCRAVDFCGYYSAGRVMNEEKASDIYNYEVLEKYQSEIFSPWEVSGYETEFIPMVYLPVFLLPFKFFALFELPVSLLLWHFLNLIVLALYLFYFSKTVSENKVSLKILTLLVISYPVLQNFYYGQVNIWLLICFAEFLRAIVSDKPYKAGLWLGGWLLKPQILILILPFLFIQKKYKALLGFIFSSVFLFAVSFILVGWEGMNGFLSLIFESAEGGAASHFQYMMNWRMLSFYISYFTSPTVGWIFFGLASIVTAAVPLTVFRKTADVKSPAFAFGLMGIIAATTAVAYHAHLHTAVILIPILQYLYVKGYIGRKQVLTWILIPYGVDFTIYVIGALIKVNLLPEIMVWAINIGYGTGMLVANLVVLGWAVR